VFRIPAIRLAEAQVGNDAGVWMYRFSRPSSAFDGAIGAGHATELPFTFNTIEAPMCLQLTGDDPPAALAETMNGAWAAFISDGVPDRPDLPTWPRYDVDRRATMDFGATTNQVIDDPAADERVLWDGVR
jgi:carboxylesterase type B